MPNIKNNVVLLLTKILMIFAIFCTCESTKEEARIHDTKGLHTSDFDQIWLSHEHILVDFIGADSINPDDWNHDSVISVVLPYLKELKDLGVDYFVDATPNYLGRDVLLLDKLADMSGLRIITNTGLYGAVESKYIPQYAYEMSAEDLAEMWIDEFENGIDGSSIKPGFIKISVENKSPLIPLHQKLVTAAAHTHLETGLTIASHTGEAKALWPQLDILEAQGVSPESFIWVHAQNESDMNNYLKAAERKCWISLDGFAWEVESHVEKILFAKENGILDRILISHDAGWYDPQKEEQKIQSYTNIYEEAYPKLKARGFSDEEFNTLMRVNPAKAFSIAVRKNI